MLQLCEKIIPAFEKVHGPGYQALIMVDNSQGHSAYAEDALLVSRMNINPGGKQARMHDGWYFQNGRKVIQPMNFPQNHPDHPNEPKGVKAVLTERGLYQRLRGKCKNKCESEAISCCNRRILELQPDFKEQKSLVQEVIEAAGHLCIFLPKFHCELNFIEFFWGVVKKYLRDNCDYTFATLKENMPKALESVHLSTIRLWEHRMYRWMEAYRSGHGTAAAQLQVRNFSSAKYKSHRRIPETVAQAFD
jgi:transposase